MSVSQELLEILVCPETGRSLSPADERLLSKLNTEIEAGRLRNRRGDPVREPIREGLLRDDGRILYVVDDAIPVMLADESIEIDGSPSPTDPSRRQPKRPAAVSARDLKSSDLIARLLAGRTFVDFDELHRSQLPNAMDDGRGYEAARDLVGCAPLAFRLPDGRSYTFRPEADTVKVVAGASSDGTIAELDENAWLEFFHELRSATGLTLSGRVGYAAGDGGDFVRWECALRALYQGRRIYDSSSRLPSRDGSVLDLEQAFRPGDDRDDMSHFLKVTGHLHVRGVFGELEVDALRGRGRASAFRCQPR